MRYSGKEIPKIIHLTCGPGKLPEVYQKCLDQLRKLHPDWAIVVHNDSESRAVISKHMPALLNVYDAYSFKIQRADMFRIAVVYIFGGFYLDMDLFCRKPLDSLCLFQLVLGEEKTLSKKENRKLRHRYLLRIANYMFGSVPGHPFWIQLLKAMVTRSQTLIRREEDILDSTGPGLLTDFYHANKNIYRDITVIQNLDRVCPNKWCGKVSCHFGDYGLHLHVGSWRWGNRKQLPSDLKQRADDGEYIEETIQLLENMHTSDNHSLGDNLILLETYDSKAGYFDGLSIVYDRARTAGHALADTSDIFDRKVLVCGIPFLYEKKISPRNTNIIFTTFESDRLPYFWVRSINAYYNYCLVPHDKVRLVFINSGVTVPISVIHQGFSRYKRKWDESPGKKYFSVGFLGVPTRRKNLSKLYRACKVLKEALIPEIKLVVHIPFLYDWMNEREFREIRNDKMVLWTVGKYDSDQISEWYNNLSCYIFPSSGEGWSFTPRESLFLGIPTILSNIPVHTELVDSGFCKIIDSLDKERADFNGQYFGEWHKINDTDILNSILDVYNNYTRYKALAMQGAEWIQDKWVNEEMQLQLASLTQSL